MATRRWNPRGRPPILRAEQLRELVEVARSSPTERGLPFTVWSVPKLAEYCRQRKLLPPVTEILRGSLVERYVTCGNPLLAGA